MLKFTQNVFSKISKSTQRIASGKPGLPKFKSVASNLVSFIYNMDECDLMNKKKYFQVFEGL